MLLKICLLVTIVAFVSGNLLPVPQENFKKLVSTSDEKPSVDETTGRCDPGTIPLMMSSWFAHATLVEWIPPASCVTGFVVSLNDSITEVPFDDSTEMYSVLYDDGIEACTPYVVAVTVVGENGTIGETIIHESTTVPAFMAGPVSNVGATFNNDSWILHWDPPALEGNCVSFYEIFLYDNRNYTNQITTTTSVPYYEVDSFVPCTEYRARITPFIGSVGGNAVNYPIDLPGDAPAPPRIVSGGTIPGFPSFVSITVSLPPFESDSCRIRYFTVQFSPDDGDTWSSFTQLYYDSPERPDEVIAVANLQENTNYTFIVSITSTGGTSEPSEPFVLLTS